MKNETLSDAMRCLTDATLRIPNTPQQHIDRLERIEACAESVARAARKVKDELKGDFGYSDPPKA